MLLLQDENEEGAQVVTKDYILFCLGRYTSQATGGHTFYSKGILQYDRACESAKSKALVRCCKDLGVASELWDPTVQNDPVMEFCLWANLINSKCLTEADSLVP